VRRDLGLAAAPAVDERDRRDRAPDETALPARRTEHELLELGPAVRLVQDPLADGVGEGIDGRPVARIASGTAEELPASFRIVGDEAVEQPEGKPAGLELRLVEQAVGEVQP
jgi:hypothetical protein